MPESGDPSGQRRKQCKISAQDYQRQYRQRGLHMAKIMQTDVKPGYTRTKQAHAKGKSSQCSLARCPAPAPEQSKQRQRNQRNRIKIKRRKTRNRRHTQRKCSNQSEITVQFIHISIKSRKIGAEIAVVDGKIILGICSRSRSRDAVQGKIGRKSGAYSKYVSMLSSISTSQCALQ